MLLTVGILLHIVISVISRDGSVIIYVFLASYQKHRLSCWHFFFTFRMSLFHIPASCVIADKISYSILNESTKFFISLIVYFHHSTIRFSTI